MALPASVKIEPPCSPIVDGNGKSKCGDIYVCTSGTFSLSCGFCESVEFYTLFEYSNHHIDCHFPNEKPPQSTMKPEPEPLISRYAYNDNRNPQDNIRHVTQSEDNSNIKYTIPISENSSLIEQVDSFEDKFSTASGVYENVDPLWTTFTPTNNSVFKKNTKDTYSRKRSWMHQPPYAYLPSYTCVYCKEELGSRKALLHHMRKVHFYGSGCSFCFKQFSSASLRRRHEKLAHRSLCTCWKTECQKCNDQKKYSKIFQCDDCKVVFPRRSELQLHMWTAHSIGYPCHVCGRHFMLSSNRNAHEKTHTGKRPHQCQYCQRTFTLRTSLNDHTKLHTGERPFLCTICGNGFVSNAKLNTHTKRVHSTEPNRYPCSICGEKFGKIYHLKQHKEKQHNLGLNICSCDICKRIFTNRKCLVQHMKIHTGKKTYKCRYCDMTFAQAAGRRGHERNKHEDICV